VKYIARTFDCRVITNRIEKHGYVILDEFIQYVKELHDLSESEILQSIFWLAQDLKFHFRIGEENLEPRKVKTILLESTEQSVAIIANKPVDDSIFQDVKCFYREISGKKHPYNYGDQYGFSRLLAKEIRYWKSSLDSFRSEAQKPYFPGKKEIDDYLDVLKEISAKLDPFSLINTFYARKDQILKLADDAKKISGFYTTHMDFWNTLITSVQEFDEHLPELQKNQDIASGYVRLKQILSSPEPYDLMGEAAELLKKVKACNDIIVKDKTKKYRTAGLTKVNDIIERMKHHLNDHQAGQDLRNNALYSLRRIIKRIGNAETIKIIDLCIEEAEEKFDTFWEEIEVNSD